MALNDLRQSEMLAHLLDSLERGKDIGHYGRLVFAMVGRYFLSEDELVDRLTKNPGFSDLEARALVLEVQSRGYSPPRRARILEWQERQDFPICPNPEDPNACDVYHDLRFPDQVYEHIEEFYEQRVRAEEPGDDHGADDHGHEKPGTSPARHDHDDRRLREPEQRKEKADSSHLRGEERR